MAHTATSLLVAAGVAACSFLWFVAYFCYGFYMKRQDDRREREAAAAKASNASARASNANAMSPLMPT